MSPSVRSARLRSVRPPVVPGLRPVSNALNRNTTGPPPGPDPPPAPSDG